MDLGVQTERVLLLIRVFLADDLAATLVHAAMWPWREGFLAGGGEV